MCPVCIDPKADVPNLQPSPELTSTKGTCIIFTTDGPNLQAFTRVDTHTGEAQTWFPGRRCFCEELVFVPGPNAASQEEDGYLLGLVYDAAKHRSFLSVSLASYASDTWLLQPICL